MSETSLSQLSGYGWKVNHWTPFQSQVDHYTTQVFHRMIEIESFCTLVGAGAAGTLTEAGLAKSAASLLRRSPFGFKILSQLATLFSETIVFDLAPKISHSLKEKTPPKMTGKESLHSLVNLGSVRFFGGVGKGQNPVLQHLLVDGGILAGQRLTEGISGKTIPEQIIEAEALHWHMKGAASLVHAGHPALFSWNTAFRLSQMEIQEKRKKGGKGFENIPWPEAVLAAEKGNLPQAPSPEKPIGQVTLVMMARPKNNPSENDIPFLSFPYRAEDPKAVRLRRVMEKAEWVHQRLLEEKSPEKLKELEKLYKELSRQFASSHFELYGEAGKWSGQFVSENETQADRALLAYQSLIPHFNKGDYFVYQEAIKIIELSKAAKTQNGRYRILKALEFLSEKFAPGDDRNYTFALWVRDWFTHKSPHTQRQAFKTYAAFAPTFDKRHEEIFRGERAVKMAFPELDSVTREEAKRTLETIEQQHSLGHRLKRWGDRILQGLFPDKE